MITQYPHCDSRVLHAPSACIYCDKFPEWQELRQTWGICFSGEQVSDERPIGDPADLAVMFKKRTDYNNWPGNRPQKD